MDLTDILDAAGVDYLTEGKDTRPGWVQIDCPFCGGKPYLGFHVEGRYFNCWKCGGLKFGPTLAALIGKSEVEAWAIARKIPRGLAYEEEKPGNYKPPEGVSALFHREHLDYLRGRGFSPAELIRLWRIGCLGPKAGRCAWRVFIPIEFGGRAVSWTTRAIGASGLRYLSASLEEESKPHKQMLYGGDYVRGATVVVEGPIDAWRIGPGAVATCGTGFSDEQLAEIGKIPVRAVCFDAEPEAQARARKILNTLAVYPGRTANVVLDSGDPAEAPAAEIRQIRRLFLGD